MSVKHVTQGFVPFLLLTLLLTGCASSKLEKKAFEGRTIAATAAFPPEANVRHPLLATAGRLTMSGFAREDRAELQHLQKVLRAATKRVDIPDRIAGDMIATAAPNLGARLSNDPKTADYLLDFRVYDYGLTVPPYGGSAAFYIDARATVRDRASGTVLWAEDLSRISNVRLKLRPDLIREITEADLEAMLQEFNAYASERMTKALRKDIKE
ncbi:MAG TPA: hypothetical protein VKP65_12655 [Rhodothermales bacterium]|nr:hypothetical protein [Rhodothermales bacterium]